jgi:hypothetical protein
MYFFCSLCLGNPVLEDMYFELMETEYRVSTPPFDRRMMTNQSLITYSSL